MAGQAVLDVVSFALGQLRVAHGNLSAGASYATAYWPFSVRGKLHFKMRIRRCVGYGTEPGM